MRGAKVKGLNLLRDLPVLILLLSCSHKGVVQQKYVGVYELELSSGVSCHFLMKNERASIPQVLCHNAENGWLTPFEKLKSQSWIAPPILTQSGSLVAFVSSVSEKKISVLLSTDLGKNWEVVPALSKRKKSDALKSVSIQADGKIAAKLLGGAKRTYVVTVDQSFKSILSPVKIIAKAYPERCPGSVQGSDEDHEGPGCLSGYLKRLLPR